MASAGRHFPVYCASSYMFTFCSGRGFFFKLTVQFHEFSCFGTDWHLHNNSANKLCVHFSSATLYVMCSQIPAASEGVITRGPVLTLPGKLPQIWWRFPKFCDPTHFSFAWSLRSLHRQSCWHIRKKDRGEDITAKYLRNLFLQNSFTQIS